MKRKIIIITLIVISVITIGVGVFLINTDILKNTTTIKDTPLSLEEKSKNLSPILEQILYYNTYLSNEFPIKDIDKLDNPAKTKFLLNITCNLETSEVSVSDLEKVGEKYFEDFKIVKKDIKTSNDQVLYKYKNNKFTYVTSEEVLYEINIKDQKIIATENKWVVQAKIYYSTTKHLDQTKIEKKIYQDIDLINKQDPLFTISSDITNYQEDIPQTVDEKLKTVTYNFKKVDQLYKLDSILFE